MGIMKKQRDQEPEAVVSLRMWTHPDAQKAVPYIRSLAQSLRDGWLDLRQAQETVERTKARPGRPNRDTLILLDESQHDIERAEAKLEEIVGDMMALSAYCVDPGAGLAVIPFLRGQELAWYVFDLFDAQGIVAWRLYSDPLEMRRPLAELDTPSPVLETPDKNEFTLPRPPAPGFEKLN
jgi:hypothetical protein